MISKSIIASSILLLLFSQCSVQKSLPEVDATAWERTTKRSIPPTDFKNLPDVDETHLNPYGAYFKLYMSNKYIYKGELIAIDSNEAIVLVKNKKATTIETIPLQPGLKFKLTFMRPKNYSWTIPAFTLMTIIPVPDPEYRDDPYTSFMPFHGGFIALTIPINLILTSIVTREGFEDAQYNQKQVSYNYLKRFARFPQGIPEGIDLKALESN